MPKQSGMIQGSQLALHIDNNRGAETARDFREREITQKAHKIIVRVILDLLKEIHKIDCTFGDTQFSVEQLTQLLLVVEREDKQSILLVLKGIIKLEIKE